MVAFSRVFAFLFLASIFSFGNPAEAQVFDWQEIELPEGVELTDVAALPDRLIAIGHAGAPEAHNGVVFTSINGFDWQPLEIEADGVSFIAVAFVRGQWLIGRSDGDLQQSIDGLNWSIISLPDTLKSSWNSILEIDDEIVLVGTGGGANSRVVSTADLENWQLRYENAPGPGGIGGSFLRNIVGSAQQLVGLGVTPAPSIPLPRLYSSADGSGWESNQIFAYDVAWNGERFVAIWLWEPPLNPIASLKPGDDWIFPTFSDAAEIRYSTIAANRNYVLLEGRTELAPKSIVISSDGGNRWVEQDISQLSPEDTTREMIAWKGGWVGVGDSIILGTPQPPQAVPALSVWAVLVFSLALSLIAFVGLRRSRV